MRGFENRVAAITGAASGIGRALAMDLAGRGAHLALADVDEAGLRETVARCEGRGVKVTADIVDVADRAAVMAWADTSAEQHGAVHLLVNNAGVALGGTAAEQPPEDVDWLMNINFWGVVHGTQAFLPHLRRADIGHIVNISSVFGLVSIPTQSAYNASKFGVRGYSDALRMELEIEDSTVSVTTVHPGGIKTNIARNARVGASIGAVGVDHAMFGDDFDRRALTSPDKAARQILKAVQRNRRRALIGPDAVVFDLLSRLPAGVYQRLLIANARHHLRTRT